MRKNIFEYNSINKDSDKHKTISLTDVLNENFPSDTLEFKIESNATLCDCFSRDKLEELIINAINGSKFKEGFVVGIEGLWGSGKTSVIKRVRKKLEKKEDIIWIDFNAWEYSDEKSLFNGFYESLLAATDLKSSFVFSKYCKKISESLVSSDKLIFSLLAQFFDNNISINDLKKEINDVLVQSNKQYIIFIDDFDIAVPCNSKLLLKLINLVFNFSNCTYILAYERKTVEDLYTNQTTEFFIDKIINWEISIPTITPDMRHSIVEKCITNTLVHYGMDKALLDDDSVKSYIKFACDKVTTVRNLVQLLNSMYDINRYHISSLYFPDLLCILFIKHFKPDLYLTIFNNRQYFVPEFYVMSHLESIDNLNRILDEDSKKPRKIEEGGQILFDKINRDYGPEYIKLLSALFSTATNYFLDNKYKYKGFRYNLSDDGKIDNYLNFSSFFDFNPTDNLKIDSLFAILQSEFNSPEFKDTDAIFSRIDSFISQITCDTFCSKIAQLYRTSENKKMLFYFCCYILNKSNCLIDLEVLSVRNSNAYKCFIFLFSILWEMDNEELLSIIDKYIDMKNIGLLSFLSTFAYRYNRENPLLQNRIDEFIDEKLNDDHHIFQNPLYVPHTFIQFFKLVNNMIPPEYDKNLYCKLIKYLSGIKNLNECIFKVAYEFIEVCYDTNIKSSQKNKQYSYVLNYALVDLLKAEGVDIVDIVKNCEARNEFEKTVKEIVLLDKNRSSHYVRNILISELIKLKD